MAIHKLSQLLINQIAAGEVIERPASVVKELIENSLDAGATRIDVTIEEGGTQLIRVADDGGGILPDELTLAVAPHATSKLQDTHDLEAIETFGFRGEALASIASVSRLRLSSVPRGEGARPAEASLAPRNTSGGGGGGVIEVAGDQVSEVKPHAGAPGSVVEVRDLFFNTPARRRFMRSAATEFGHIHDTVLRAAMAHPRVGFRLTHNGRMVRDLPPDQDRATRCVELLGKDLAEGLLEFEQEDRIARPAQAGLAPGQGVGGYTVWGLAGQPSLAKAAGKSQYLCINGRPIRDRNLQHAIKEAYRGLIPPDRFPVAVVFLTVDPTQVDVNVHPTKSEVRFREPSRVHGLVQAAMRQRLLGADLTPSAGVSSFGFRPLQGSDSGPPSAEGFVDYFRRMAPEQKSLAYEDLKRELADAEPKLIEPDAQTPTPGIPETRPTPILQISDSYIVTEDEHGGILIIDQHALHERVMFEQLRRRVLEKQENLESQRLLMPVIVEAPRKEQDLEQLRPLLERIGLEVEPIGPDALAVQAFPSFLFDRKVDPAKFVNELLDRADNGDFAPSASGDATLPLEAALHEVLDMMACKAAVKAGDRMGEHELAELLKLRLEVERSSNCPHGRPTSLRLTLKDLEKQFGRT